MLFSFAVANAKKGHDEKEELELAAGNDSTNTTGDHRDDTAVAAKGSYVNQVVNRFESGKMQQDSSATDAGTASSTPEKATATAKIPLTAVGRSESLKAQKKAQIKPGVRKKSDPAHFYRDDIEDFAEQNGSDTAPVSAGSSSTSVQSLPTDGSLLFEDDDADFEADPEHRPNWQAILTDPSDGDTLGRSSFSRNKEFLFRFSNSI